MGHRDELGFDDEDLELDELWSGRARRQRNPEIRSRTRRAKRWDVQRQTEDWEGVHGRRHRTGHLSDRRWSARPRG